MAFFDQKHPSWAIFLFLVATVGALILFWSGSRWDYCAPRSENCWARHTIDNSFYGADGIRLFDVNGDHLEDIATGWEEGGKVRVYLNPGYLKSNQSWPSVTVGSVGSPEDAVFADLDADGAVDVISATEGKSNTAFVHWAPTLEGQYLKASEWQTDVLGNTLLNQRWMFMLPMDMDHRNGIDIVTGSKGPGAAIGWFEAPVNPRDVTKWNWHLLYKAGWIMSLLAYDIDKDGDLDIVSSDRRGGRSGVLWLENPGKDSIGKSWPEHRIGPVGEYEAMFITIADLDADGSSDIIAATKGGAIYFFRQMSNKPLAWDARQIAMPNNTGTGKAVAVGDIDGDGHNDIVFSTEAARDSAEGIMWLSFVKSPLDRTWFSHGISGPAGRGTKYDLVELLDVDGDGDLDVVTTEEKSELGVVWYENPLFD